MNNNSHGYLEEGIEIEDKDDIVINNVFQDNIWAVSRDRASTDLCTDEEDTVSLQDISETGWRYFVVWCRDRGICTLGFAGELAEVIITYPCGRVIRSVGVNIIQTSVEVDSSYLDTHIAYLVFMECGNRMFTQESDPSSTLR